ncbi:DUF397 domain-containing protein [Streptomyces sp. NPDC048565]|uniref:DUF397 domain-containing protein n=1 Tax=Streptomyces sp. NPDC048565 TaxID=3155266 RepID=UPI0034211F12
MNDESGYRWHRSTYSGETNGCLEIRTPPQLGRTRIRDSKDRFRPPLICTTESWMSFVRSVSAQEWFQGPVGR